MKLLKDLHANSEIMLQAPCGSHQGGPARVIFPYLLTLHNEQYPKTHLAVSVNTAFFKSKHAHDHAAWLVSFPSTRKQRMLYLTLTRRTCTAMRAYFNILGTR